MSCGELPSKMPDLIQLKHGKALLILTRPEYLKALKRGKSVIENRRFARECKKDVPVWER